MALTQGLLHMALLALCWRPSVTETQDTVPLQTLQCYNDYTSRIICSWADTEDAQGLINMTLYRRLDSDQAVSCDISENLLWSSCPSPHRCVPRRCVIPYNLFVVADEDYYSFQPDRELGIQLTVPLDQHGEELQALPRGVLWIDGHPWSPHALGLAWTQGSSRTQAASGSPSTHPSQALCFLSCSPAPTSQGHPSARDFRGHWASWGRGRWVTDAGSVHSTMLPREEECSPVEEQQAGLFIHYHCGINVSNPSAHSRYTVSVKPRKQGKYIPSSNHIQMPSPTLNVTKDGDTYNLHWETEKMSYSHINHQFQVQYKMDSVNWEDSKTETVKQAHSMLLPALKPATAYGARVRVMPTPGYHGIWSEWSKEASWTTEWVLPTWGLALILVFITLALLTALRFGSVYGYRLNKRWKEKIPNPRKCILFQDGPAGFWPPHSMGPFITKSPTPQGPRGSLFTELEGVSSPHLGESEVSPLTIEDPNIIQDPPSGPDTTPAASSEPMEQHPNPHLDPSVPSDRPESQIPSFDFNGPYLGPPHSRSLPDLVGQPVPPQTGGSLKSALPGSLEYLCLPPGGQVQLVPLAQAMEQGQAVDVECELSLGAKGSPSTEFGDKPSPEPRVEGKDPRDNQVALPMSFGGPEDPVVASGYVTPADLVLTVPSGTQSLSLAPSLGSPSTQSLSLCLGLTGGSPGTAAPGPQGFEGYVELPPSTSQSPSSSLCNSILPVPSSPVVSLEEPREEGAPASPHPEGLLVLQQVGDYCFLPGLGPGSLSPRSKPSSPSLCPEMEDLDQVLPVKKLPYQQAPQVPAIQFFKSLKQQDYLSLPPWDFGRSREVC
uniref:Cytokine receptor common subunit beta n=1 Tax=Nannospalax galili TaxID=1026970 RepID=A0A8C6W237_NANGA